MYDAGWVFQYIGRHLNSAVKLVQHRRQDISVVAILLRHSWEKIMKICALLLFFVGIIAFAIPDGNRSTGDRVEQTQNLRPSEGFEENDVGWCTTNPGNDC